MPYASPSSVWIRSGTPCRFSSALTLSICLVLNNIFLIPYRITSDAPSFFLCVYCKQYIKKCQKKIDDKIGGYHLKRIISRRIRRPCYLLPQAHKISAPKNSWGLPFNHFLSIFYQNLTKIAAFLKFPPKKIRFLCHFYQKITII